MGAIAKVAVIIAASGLATALFLPGRTTATSIGAVGTALTSWTKAAQGR